MGDTFIFIMGLICTGSVVAATFLSINELKDVNEPQLDTMNRPVSKVILEVVKRHSRPQMKPLRETWI